MDALLQDVRYAARTLAKSRGFTLVAVLTLGLGVGVNTAIFSAVNAIMLRPLPYRDAERLVVPTSVRVTEPDGYASVTYADLLDWQKEERLFAHAAVFQTGSVNLASEQAPERVHAATVTDGFFPALGAPPLLGRAFVADDFRPNSDRPAVISEGLWRRSFGADPGIVGTTIRVSSQPVTVVGVMPDAARWPRDADLWRPLPEGSVPQDELMRRDNRVWQAIARLGPGVSLEQARTRLAAVARRVAQDHPVEMRDWTTTAVPVGELVVGSKIRRGLWVLLGAVGFVLLIACVNVANLLLARAAAREREIAVRAALGAQRARLIRQFLTESVLLALLGGAAGVGLAVWGVDAIVALAPADAPRIDEVAVDGRVLGFALLLSLCTAVVFGLVPALQGSSANTSATLRDGARRSSGGVRARRARSLLIVAEVALSLVLLIGAGLMMKSFARLQGVTPGVDVDNVLTLTVSLPGAKYARPARGDFYAEVLRRVEALPGVESAAMASALPLAGGGFYLGRSFLAEGQPEPPAGPDFGGMWNVVSPGYFRTVGMPLLQGRDFTPRDDSASTPVVVVTASMARRLFGDADPIGRRIRSWRDENVLREIVGVVGDVRYFGLDADLEPLVFVPHRQDAWGTMALTVRTTGEPATAAGAVRRVITSLDADLAVADVRTMREVLARSLATSRAVTLLLGAFGALALLLAAIGLYGVVSYAVTQRTNEIGIRVALGAGRGDVRRLVLRQGMALAGAGVVLGVGGALATTRVLSGLLYDVSPTDPVTFVALPLVLVGVALLASYLPARRAMRVSPTEALRYE